MVLEGVEEGLAGHVLAGEGAEHQGLVEGRGDDAVAPHDVAEDPLAGVRGQDAEGHHDGVHGTGESPSPLEGTDRNEHVLQQGSPRLDIRGSVEADGKLFKPRRGSPPMADTLQLIVRFLHILFGVAWVGGALFYGHAVAGGLKNLPAQVKGPAMGAVQRKMMSLFLVAGPATLIFGLWNQYLVSGALNFRDSTWNMLLGASLVLTVIMLAIAFLWNLPAFRRLEELTAEGAPQGSDGEEAEDLKKRLMIGGMTITVLGVVVLALMVAATLAPSSPV